MALKRPFFLASLLVMLVVAVVLAGGFAVAPDKAQARSSGRPVIVSMGDSYSSGEGTEPFYDQNSQHKYQSRDWLAHRSELAWPGLLEIDSKQFKDMKGDGWYFVASSGAETRHLLSDFQKKEWSTSFVDGGSLDLAPQKNVFMREQISGIVDYVTLTIGGNDVGFADIMEAGVKDVSFVRAGGLKGKIKSAISKFRTTTKKDLQNAYREIMKEAGGQSTLIVAGYPHLLPSDGRWFFDKGEAELINGAVDIFDDEVSELIAQMNDDAIVFADVRAEFDGHEEQYINDVFLGRRDQDLTFVAVSSAYSMHPNEYGQIAYKNVVQEVIKDAEANKQVSRGVDIDSEVAMSLVFDVSGSMDERSAMGGMTKLASAKKQSSDFVRSVGDADGPGGLSVKVGVASFADIATSNCGLSNNPDDIVASITALKADGMTNMYAGLETGINQLLGESGPKLMVFLSDGLSNEGKSRADIVDLARQAADQDITIYTIGFGPSGSLDEALLREIADITGGTYEHEDSSNISSATVGLFATMMNARLQATSEVIKSVIGAVGLGALDDAGAFDITKNGTVQVYLYWPGSVLDMQLTDPNGTLVAEGYPGVTVDTSTIPTSIRIENAKQGTWNMAVYGQEVSMAEEPYYAVAAFNETEAPAATGGGGASNGGEGLIFLLLVVSVACVVGVFAFTKRRSSDDL